MLTRPLNPDRINEIIALMNKYAVNGVVDGNNPDYQAEKKAIEEKYENMEAQGGDSQLPPPFKPGEQGVEGVNNLPPNDNQQLPPFKPGEQGVEGVNNLPPNDNQQLPPYSMGEQGVEGVNNLPIPPTEDSKPVQIYNAFAQNDPLLAEDSADQFGTLGGILAQSVEQSGNSRISKYTDKRDYEFNPQRHQIASAIFKNDAGDVLQYNFVGKRAGEFSYDKRPSSLEGYKLVSGTFRNNTDDKDIMFFDVPEEFQNYDYTNALKSSPTLAAEQYAEVTKDDKSDNDIYYIDPDGNRQVDITGTGYGIPVGSTHIGLFNAHSDSVNNASALSRGETFTPSEGVNFYQAAFTKGTDGFYVTGSDQDPFKDNMVGSFNYDETTGTDAKGVNSDFLNEYKFGKDGPTSSFMDTITDEEGNLRFGSESSFDLGAAFGFDDQGNYILSSFPSDRINLEGFMTARGTAGSDAQFLYNQMDKSANFAELFGKGEGLKLPENFFTDTNIMQDTMNQYLQGDDTKKRKFANNNLRFHDSFDQITRSGGYRSGNPFEDKDEQVGPILDDDKSEDVTEDVSPIRSSPFIPFSGFVVGEDKREIEVPSTPRTFEPDPRLDPIFPAYAQPETTSVTTPNVSQSVTTPNVSQGASLAEIMASPDPTVLPGMNPYFSGITTANQPDSDFVTERINNQLPVPVDEISPLEPTYETPDFEAMAKQALKMNVGLIDYSPNYDINNDGKVSAGEALQIYKGEYNPFAQEKGFVNEARGQVPINQNDIRAGTNLPQQLPPFSPGQQGDSPFAGTNLPQQPPPFLPGQQGDSPFAGTNLPPLGGGSNTLRDHTGMPIIILPNPKADSPLRNPIAETNLPQQLPPFSSGQRDHLGMPVFESINPIDRRTLRGNNKLLTSYARGGGIYSLNNRMLQGMASPSMYKGIMS